ncbi:hypothetical protein AVEN_86797-1 [Araneus ventricosus]|uniref:Uncharacterized protein n=1 Tax=Araneus ventricosus TaxID=182803 RepID=A0A4Y2UJD3_ARAVE|nr:hypothetical protein AVEN_86797-1 [Araneus ventricosus]
MVCVSVIRKRASTTLSFRARGWNHNWAQKLPAILFTPIECTLCEMTNKKDLSTDQLYLMEICEAINCGHCRESLSKRNPGKVSYSRWPTTVNRILRLYM